MISCRNLAPLWGVLAACSGVSTSYAFQAPAKPAELVASTEPKSPEDERAAFKLPPGFMAQLVASEPEIAKPMNLAFDARGRLWVTHSTEYPFPAKPGTTPRDKVSILANFDRNGRARTIIPFAENLNIPIGVLPDPKGDSALVYSIPSIDRFTDTDGDGRADKREPTYASFGFVDTHGMASGFTWGFDGFIYACHGFANDSQIQGKTGPKVSMNSGNTYRIARDGSRIEQRTWGQVNPFGLSFDPLGYLYSCDCHSKPLYQLIRGGYYPSFGKPHDGLGFAPEMCRHDHYSTGIAGVAYYAAAHFPPAWRGTMFVGNVVNSRINHDRLEWNGSSPRAIEQPDFLVSEDPWFRPVDLEIGPDGALYVADFYNRIIGHYEVDINHPGRDRTRGRIWRIVYTGSEPSTPARQVNRDWWNVRTSDLVRALGSPNLALRMIAANVMVDRGGEEVIKGALDAWRGGSPDARVHALWILERLHALDESLWALSAQNDEASLRVHAMRVASGRERWSLGMHEAVSLGLADLNPHVQRAAAEAIAAHPSRDWIRPLLATLAHADAADDHLAHTLRIAIRDQLARAPSSWQLLAWSPWTDADRARLAAIATGVHSKEAARFLLDSLDTARGSGPIPDEQAHHIARWGDDALLASLVKTARPKLEPAASLGMIRELVRGARERGGRLEASTRAWALATASALLDAKDLGQQVSAIELAESAQLSELSPNVAAVLRDRAAREHARQAAARTILAIDPNTAASALAEILAAGDEPVAVREHAASWLGRLVASHPEARRDMAQALTLAEGRLQNHIAAQLAGSVEGARLLLETIESGKASARLLQERAVSLPLGQKAQSIDRLAERIGALTAGLEPPEAKVQSLIDQRRDEFTHRPGDAARGASVFKTNCAPCHQINGEGSKIGPQLDGVGSRGLARLLEDVLDPNRNVDQAFRSTTLALENGQVFSGLLLREEGDVLVLADNEGKEQRHGKGDIEERKVTNLSPMPAAMADKLAPADLADLMAYLLRQTTKPAAAAGAP